VQLSHTVLFAVRFNTTLQRYMLILVTLTLRYKSTSWPSGLYYVCQFCTTW